MKPHVAFLPSPGMGHMIPLFQLAKKLTLQHGFRVSFIVITTGASAAQNQFFHSAAAISPDLSIINLPAADVSDMISDEMRVVTQIGVITRESLKPLKPTLAELKPSSLVIDIFTTDAIDTCTELKIPVYSFFTASTALLTLSLYLPTLDREVEGEYVDLPAPVEIPGCRKMPTADLLDQVKDRTNDEYKWYLLHVSRLPYTAGILVNAWDDLDQHRIKALTENPFFKNLPTPPVYPVGPLIKDDEIISTEKDAKILAWLDSQPRESVLFVCLGSGGTLSSRQLIELAAGLELSRQRFVLVARPPTDASGSGAYFSVGTGGGEDADGLSVYFPDGFLDRTRGVGLVVPAWAPQMAVLRHQSTGAFLSHCGWNSTLESLVCGVPMIAWPLYAEQRMNATMLVEEVGVAVKVAADAEAEVIGREEIGRVVRAVMEGEEGKVIRRRAGELKENARKASENGGGLSRFVDICHLDI